MAAAEKIEKMVEELSTWNVMDVAELSKALEEKWGVTAAAAAPVMMAAAGGGEAGGAEEKTEFDVVLESAGGNKIAVIKEVRAMTGLGLKEAKEKVEAGGVIVEGADKDKAEEAKKKLEDAGATVALK